MLTIRLLLLSLLFLLPAVRLDVDPCTKGTPIATPAPGETVDDPCAGRPTPAGSTVNLPFASTGNLQTGSNAAETTRNNYLIAAGVTTVALAVAGFMLYRRPNKK